MPFVPQDAHKHKQGLSEQQASVWARVANQVAEACRSNGGADADCNTRSISVANSVIDKVGESTNPVVVLPNNWAESDDQHAFVFEGDVTKESEVPLIGDLVDLTETLREASTPNAYVRLLAPGPSKNGREYPASVIERDGPKAFAKGTHMFWDHPTDTEESERPEGSLNNLAAITTTAARFDAAGPEGPGLYAHAKVFDPYRESLKSIAPHIGVSIRASGRVNKDNIVEEISNGRSVDFVTKPAAGGAVVALFESVRKGHQPMDKTKELETKLAEAEAEITKLTEAKKERDELKTQNRRMQEANVTSRAKEVVREALKDEKLPDVTKARLSESLAQNPPTVEDNGELKIDEPKLREAVKTAATEEAKYLSEASGGIVTGFGEGAPNADKSKELSEANAAHFRTLGLSESESKTAAVGRI